MKMKHVIIGGILAGTLALTGCSAGQVDVTTSCEIDVVTTEDAGGENTTDNTNADAGLDAYVGYYTDGGYNEVVIENNGGVYTMSAGFYRIASIDEGTVVATDQGVEFDAVDLEGNPIIFSFYQEDGAYVLHIDESSWEYLHTGDTYVMEKTTREEAYPALTTDFGDGTYSSVLRNSGDAEEPYVRSVEFTDGGIMIEAAFDMLDPDTYEVINSYDDDNYFFAIDENTTYIAGGEGETMNQLDFESYIMECLDSGVGLEIVVENGVAVSVGIYS